VPFLTFHGLHAQSPHVEQFTEGYHHHSSYSHVVCSYYQSFDNDVNSCLYYDISNECHAGIVGLPETMNERHECFASGIRECARSVPSLRL